MLHLFILDVSYTNSHNAIHPCNVSAPQRPKCRSSKITTKALLAPQSKIQYQHQGLTTENGNMNLEWLWTIHISLHFQVQTLLRFSIPLTKGPQLSSHQVWEDWWNLVPWWWLNLNKDRITVTVHDGWIMVGSLEQIGWGAVQYISTCVNQQPKPPTLVDQPWSTHLHLPDLARDSNAWMHTGLVEMWMQLFFQTVN